VRARKVEKKSAIEMEDYFKTRKLERGGHDNKAALTYRPDESSNRRIIQGCQGRSGYDIRHLSGWGEGTSKRGAGGVNVRDGGEER